MASLEAMACGVPLIATASGCYLEIVKDGFNGILCRPDYLMDDFIKALIMCEANRSLASQLGTNARNYVENKLPRSKVIGNFCSFLDGRYENIDSDMSL